MCERWKKERNRKKKIHEQKQAYVKDEKREKPKEKDKYKRMIKMNKEKL